MFPDKFYKMDRKFGFKDKINLGYRLIFMLRNSNLIFFFMSKYIIIDHKNSKSDRKFEFQEQYELSKFFAYNTVTFTGRSTSKVIN